MSQKCFLLFHKTVFLYQYFIMRHKLFFSSNEEYLARVGTMDIVSKEGWSHISILKKLTKSHRFIIFIFALQNVSILLKIKEE